MHILIRGFSNSHGGKASKRRTPRDLHIRKVSFSGSSLSSASDASTLSTTPRSPPSMYPSQRDRSDSVSTSTTVYSFDGRFSPSGLAPPRLHDRPMKPSDKDNYEAKATFFDDDSSEDELDHDDEKTLEGDDSGYEMSVREVLDYQTSNENLYEEDNSLILYNSSDDQEKRDSSASYLTLDLTKRPPMPCSRWSESTIQTLDTYSRPTSINDFSGLATPYQEDSDNDEEIATPMPIAPVVPNFSYKRDKVAGSADGRRPPMKTTDTVEEVIKRGGWKRRGVLFHNEEMAEEANSGELQD